MCGNAPGFSSRVEARLGPPACSGSRCLAGLAGKCCFEGKPLPRPHRLRYLSLHEKVCSLPRAAPGLSGARADGPDDQYVQIYNLIQEADTLNSAGQASEALPKYLEAQTGLQMLQKGYPDWNAKVVNFRLDYVRRRIAVLSPRSVAPVAPAPVAPGVSDVVPERPPAPTAPVAPAASVTPPAPAAPAQPRPRHRPRPAIGRISSAP